MKVKLLLTVDVDFTIYKPEDVDYLATLTEERIEDWRKRYVANGSHTAFYEFKVEALKLGTQTIA